MAATVDSFSIREYVLKKRSVDLGTCWPFGEDTSRKEKKDGFNLLPPIVCRKFRWWAFENHKIKRSSTGDEDGAGGSKSNQELPENFETLANTDVGGQITVVLESDSGFDVGNLKAVLDGESGFEEEEGSIVKLCPVCKTFTSTTINAVNAHIDNCLAQASWGEKKQAKHKSRVPKKRSIVEIFAAAPHVETLDEEDEDERVREEEQEEKEEEQQSDEDNGIERDGFGLDQYGSIIEPQQQQPEEGRSEKVELSKARRRRKTKLYDEESLPKRKEKRLRLKLPPPADFSRLPQAMLRKKNLKKLTAGPRSIQAKKPSNAKKVPKQKQLKIIRGSKLVSKHSQVDPPVLPIHSILRNQVKPSGRHVRFSGKDDILGCTNKSCSPTGLSQTETLHKIISDAMADLSVKERPYSPEASYPSRNSQAINEARESIESDDDVSVIEGNGNKNLNDNALPSVISSNNRSCHDLEKVALSEPMDLNQALQQFDNLHVLNPGLSYLLNSFSKEGISPVTSTQTEGSASRIPCASKRLPASLENPTARFSNMSSLPNLSRTTTIHHPISCIGTNLEPNVRPPFRLELNKQSSSSLLQYPLCPLPQDLTASLHASLTEPKRRLTRKNGHFGESNMSSSGMIPSCASRGKSIDEDFLGLPLNLSGKLGSNPLSSYPVYNLVGRKFSPDHFDMQDNTQNAKTPPNHNLIFFPDQNYSKKIQTNRPVSSMLGFTKLIDNGRMNELSRDSLKEKQMKSLSLSDSELPMVNVFGPVSRDYNQPQDIRGNEKSRGNLDFGYRHPTQPMVRLMGKNVMVGRSNNEEGQVFEESKIWKDKEITTGNEAVANQCFRQERITDLVSRASKDNENNLLDPYSSPNLPKILQFPSSQPGFDPSFLSSNTHLMSRNDLSLRNGRYGTNFNDLVYLPSQALPSNQKSKPISSFISEIESSQISHQNPITACNPLSACLQHYQNFPYREKSAFQFPFSNQDFGENIQSSWPQSPPSSLPQWLLTATQQKETPQSSEPSQVSSDPIGRTNSPMICGTHLLPSSPFLTSALTFSTHKPNTCNPCLKNSYAASSLNKPLLMPAFLGYKSAYAINTSLRNRSKLQQKCNSKFTRDTGHVKKVKKRPATKAADPTKPIKRMKVDMQEKSSKTRTGSKKREQLCEYTLHNAGASELDICREKTMDAFFSAIDIDRNGLRAGGGIICFNQDGLGRSGPVKLSAGAKHILKPSQNAHQDGSRPTHSTIPFMLATGADKAPDLQKKAAKIYRF